LGRFEGTIFGGGFHTARGLIGVGGATALPRLPGGLNCDANTERAPGCGCPAAKSVVNGDRPVTASEEIEPALSGAQREAAAALPLPGTRIISGLQANALISAVNRPPGTARLNAQLVSRTGVCEELALEALLPARIVREAWLQDLHGDDGRRHACQREFGSPRRGGSLRGLPR
jgi:hypothetical protein